MHLTWRFPNHLNCSMENHEICHIIITEHRSQWLKSHNAWNYKISYSLAYILSSVMLSVRCLTFKLGKTAIVSSKTYILISFAIIFMGYSLFNFIFGLILFDLVLLTDCYLVNCLKRDT